MLLRAGVKYTGVLLPNFQTSDLQISNLLCDPLSRSCPRTYLRTVVTNRHNDAVRVRDARNIAGDKPSRRVQHQPQATKVARYVLGGGDVSNENGRRWCVCGVFVLCYLPQVPRCDVLFVCDNINPAYDHVE